MHGGSVTVDLDQIRRRPGADLRGQLFLGVILLAVLLAFAMVGAVIWDVVGEGWSIVSSRLWDFLTSRSSSDRGPSTTPTRPARRSAKKKPRALSAITRTS